MTTLSNEELAAIKAEHHPAVDGEDGGCCGDNYDCGWEWPCPTFRLASALLAAAPTG